MIVNLHQTASVHLKRCSRYRINASILNTRITLYCCERNTDRLPKARSCNQYNTELVLLSSIRNSVILGRYTVSIPKYGL